MVDGQRSRGMSLGDAVIAPRTAGPSRHVHTREDEGIYVIDGVLTAEVDGQRSEVGAGAFLWMPRGLPHTFANLSDEPVHGLGLINPSGFEQFFAEIAEYVASTGGSPTRTRSSRSTSGTASTQPTGHRLSDQSDRRSEPSKVAACPERPAAAIGHVIRPPADLWASERRG